MFNPLNLGVFRLMFLVGEVYFLAPEGCVCFCLKGKVLYISNIFFNTGALLGYTHAMDVLLGYTHPRTGYIRG